MKKIFICLTAAILLAACSNDIEDTAPYQKTEDIQFFVGGIDVPAGAKGTTRAGEHNHIPWDAAKHANTLGVFGLYEGSISNMIFNNQKVVYNGAKWEYTPAKYWAEYLDKNSFDFFGYMTEPADLPTASLTMADGEYTLGFAASISSPILTSADNMPLICHAPKHTSVTGDVIPFEMDQTLEGFNIWFQLGEKMSSIRYFVIKSVKLYGDNLPVGNKVSRTYTFADDAWTANSVVWSDMAYQSITSDASVTLAQEWELEPDAKRKISSKTQWVKWGDDSDIEKAAFYGIPHESFQPTIEVVYDVYTDADADGEGGTLSRKDVKSTIILNKTNFTNFLMGSTGEIHAIRIKIVPDYLYVLSDDDMATGILVVE